MKFLKLIKSEVLRTEPIVTEVLFDEYMYHAIIIIIIVPSVCVREPT